MGRMVELTMSLPEFYLDENLDWDVTIYQEFNSYANKKVITDDDLVDMLKGRGKCSTISNDDGPEFKALRNQLEELGYIMCQRTWWNGDYVLKPFKLNGVKFKVQEQFASGAAMKHHLEFSRNYKKDNAK